MAMTRGGPDPYVHGNSHAYGKDTFRKGWERRQLLEMQVTSYDSDEPSPKAA
jgi:hypothetical protein